MERLNLKICIENDENSESDDEKPVIIPRLSDSESEIDSGGSVRTQRSRKSRDSRSYTRSRSNSSSSSSSSGSSPSSSSSSSSSGSSSNSGSESEDEKGTTRSEAATTATLNVSLDQDHKLLQDPKRYENKAGAFVTGFDPLSEEFRKKRNQRAERFGIKHPVKDGDEFDIKELYESLGITQQDLKCGERGIRLEAVHIRGVDEMSTKDVFKYFEDYGAASIEWIDDSSCNVIWEDSVTAARALINLSSKIDKDSQTIQSLSRSKSGSVRRQSENDKGRRTSQDDKAKNSEEQNMEVDDPNSKNENEDDFDYNLNLMSEDEDENVKKDELKDVTNDKNEGDEVSKAKSSVKEDEAMQTDNDEPPEMNPPVSPPPGRWRLGIPFPGKARQLFLRYSTKADQKVAGAEKRSKYYQKYGNPNFGGMRGIISESRKRRIRAARYRKEETLAKKIVSKSKKFTEIGEETEFDRHLREALERQRKLKMAQDSNSEMSSSDDDEDSGDSLAHPHVEYSDVEDELRAMMGLETDSQPVMEPPSKKRYMRMHADDLEEKQDKQKSNRPHFAISIQDRMSDVRHRLVDARALITGRPQANTDRGHRVKDLRSRLGRKRASERQAGRYRDLSGMPSLTIQVEPD